MRLRRASAVTVLALVASGSAYAASDWQQIAFVSSTVGVSSSRLCMGTPGGQKASDIGCPSYSPYVTSGGLLGVGTSSPTATLQVSGSFIVSTSAQTTNPSLYVGTNGNVGIGVTSPTYALQLGSGQLSVPNGSNGAASIIFAGGGASTGFYNDGAGNRIDFANGGTNTVNIINTAFQLHKSLELSWDSVGAPSNESPDIALSRGAAGKLYVGNGNQGDYSGALIAGNVGIATQTPTTALEVSGTISATHFVGDGSGLTGLASGGAGTAWSQIASTDIGSAVTTYTFSGLSGDSDVEYQIVARIVAGSSSGTSYSVEPNGDTTSNVYGWVWHGGFGPGSYGASSGTSSNGMPLGYTSGSGKLSASISTLYAHSGKVRTMNTLMSQDVSGASVGGTLSYAGSWNNSANVITSLVISADQSSGLGVGTHLELWAKRNIGGPGSTPAGSSGYVQFNNGGSFGGDSGFNYVGGNVGIGTTNPNAALEVSGTVSATHFVGDGSGLTGVGGSSDKITSGTTKVTVNSATSTISFTTNGSVANYVDGSGRFVMTGISMTTNQLSATTGYFSGNVGIGTTAPKFQVHSVIGTPGFVQSTATATFVGDNNSPLGSGSGMSYGVVGHVSAPSAVSGDKAYGGYFSSNANTSAAEIGLYVDTADANNSIVGEFYANASPIMVIKGNDTVGIGTATPATTLEVSGTVSATHFVGDGSGLTGVVAAGSDRITSGTTSVIANNNTGVSVSTPLDVSGSVHVSGTVQVAGTGSEVCDDAHHGAIRLDPVTNMVQMCRQ